MMLRVNVRGGTAAGRRIVKRTRAWVCECIGEPVVVNGYVDFAAAALRFHPGDRYSCPDCGARRP